MLFERVEAVRFEANVIVGSSLEPYDDDVGVRRLNRDRRRYQQRYIGEASKGEAERL